ncbi:hypothetical protein GCM10022402_02870 [Salinactinospora qingdaonensis]|uniref:Uncharacterized protein n=1 Tax=Salinactinospora qingdaonensis TaxID=702744 RepID=A0ABP7EYH3_9ACTN
MVALMCPHDSLAGVGPSLKAVQPGGEHMERFHGPAPGFPYKPHTVPCIPNQRHITNSCRKKYGK